MGVSTPVQTGQNMHFELIDNSVNYFPLYISQTPVGCSKESKSCLVSLILRFSALTVGGLAAITFSQNLPDSQLLVGTEQTAKNATNRLLSLTALVFGCLWELWRLEAEPGLMSAGFRLTGQIQPLGGTRTPYLSCCHCPQLSTARTWCYTSAMQNQCKIV